MLLYWPTVRSKRLRARRPNLQCWLCTMSLVHDVGEAAVSLSHRSPSHASFRCHWGESSLFLLIFHSLRGFNFCCGLKLLSYNIKAKPNGNGKILLVDLVWFFNRFESDSPHNCSVFRDRSWAGAHHIFLYFHIKYFHQSTVLTWKHIVGGVSIHCS